MVSLATSRDEARRGGRIHLISDGSTDHGFVRFCLVDRSLISWVALSLKGVYATGYAVLGLTAVSSIGLAML